MTCAAEWRIVSRSTECLSSATGTSRGRKRPEKQKTSRHRGERLQHAVPPEFEDCSSSRTGRYRGRDVTGYSHTAFAARLSGGFGSGRRLEGLAAVGPRLWMTGTRATRPGLRRGLFNVSERKLQVGD